jgi:hypothetical protein
MDFVVVDEIAIRPDYLEKYMNEDQSAKIDALINQMYSHVTSSDVTVKFLDDIQRSTEMDTQFAYSFDIYHAMLQFVLCCTMFITRPVDRDNILIHIYEAKRVYCYYEILRVVHNRHFTADVFANLNGFLHKLEKLQ